jgi:hypothetical protein
MNELSGIGDDKPFTLRLAETIAWCKDRWNPADIQHSLRSVDLQPYLLAGSRASMVHFLALKRSTLLRPTQIEPTATQEELLGGKLLCYFPDEGVWDSAAQWTTSGFFDDHDAPGWDTWVGLFEAGRRGSYLVSWVPSELKELVERGIAANPVECISWLEQTDVVLRKELEEIGLLNRDRIWWK